ncbi:MAG: hypothetical protein HY706_03325 [Candidatus Hydrogenedentes bacterium]|nr:hypothetical protein [Candidatus Hydrogenedentota bacterium]
MRTSFFSKLGIGILVAVVAVGCASTGGKSAKKAKGPDDMALIKNTLSQWEAGVVAKDVNQVMGTISESFVGSEAGTKADMQRFLTGLINEGQLNDAKINMANAKTVIDGGQATVAPVDIDAAFGAASLYMTLKKEGEAWLISGMEASER